MNYSWNLNEIPILQLGSEFYDPAEPAPFPLMKLRYLNPNIPISFPEERLWDFKPLSSNMPNALALRYHGHQFQHYNPHLGDGRGFLYAQFKHNKQWYDLGTKGSGQTKYSRSGDGRLTLKGAVREALATEMLYSKGVQTSQTLCFFETGENLTRGDEPSPTRSAVLTRFSLGHIRFGTFQRLAFLKEVENIKKLTSYCLNFYYSEQAQQLNFKDETFVASAFLDLVCQRNAQLAAEVMLAGFVHGVLNTDNMNISGELFDYGPYRFLPQYDPQFTAAYFDQQGLYAYGRQPTTFLWNLQQLAFALEVAFPELISSEILERFNGYFNEALQKYFLKRLNLRCDNPELITDTISLFYQLMKEKDLYFEQTFFDFHSFDLDHIQKSEVSVKYSGPVFEKLKLNFSKMTCSEIEKKKNPYFKKVKPETLLIDELESIWSAIENSDDWSLFEKKLQSIRELQIIYR